jgi:hypothetical protein
MQPTFALLILVFALTGCTDQNAPLKPVFHQNQYCEMVQIYHDSKGEFGWPPFKGECI